jgi:hypothetical protein
VHRAVRHQLFVHLAKQVIKKKKLRSNDTATCETMNTATCEASIIEINCEAIDLEDKKSCASRPPSPFFEKKAKKNG